MPENKTDRWVAKKVYDTWIGAIKKFPNQGIIATYLVPNGLHLHTKCVKCKHFGCHTTENGDNILKPVFRTLAKNQEFCRPDYIEDMKTRIEKVCSQKNQVFDEREIVLLDVRCIWFEDIHIHHVDFKRLLENTRHSTSDTKCQGRTKECLERICLFRTTFSSWLEEMKMNDSTSLPPHVVEMMLKSDVFKPKEWLHYKDFFRVVSKHNVSQAFGGDTPTLGRVSAFIRKIKEWFKKTAFQLKEVWEDLPKKVKDPLRASLEVLYKLSSLTPLELSLWLHKNPGMRKTVSILLKMEPDEITEQKLLSVYDPDNRGVTGAERRKRDTYNNCKVGLTWSKSGDMDLHMVCYRKDGTQLHVYWKHTKEKGICLDNDNTRGGSNAYESISFDPKILLEQGFVAFRVFVLCYSNPGKLDIDFDVSIKTQSGLNISEKGFCKSTHDTGVDPELACYSSEKFDLKVREEKVGVRLMKPLPHGFGYVGPSKEDTKNTESKTVRAGTGQMLHALMTTPGRHFKYPVTPFKLTYQVTTDVKEGHMKTVGDRIFVHVGTIPIYPTITHVGFLKRMFKRGDKNMKIFKEDFEGKLFSPIWSPKVRVILDCLQLNKLDDNLSNLVLSYLGENPSVDVYVERCQNLQQGAHWWSV